MVTTFSLSLKHFPENAALWGKTSQSSNYGNWVPTDAIDGLLTTWAHTNTETDPWWRVDLLKVYRVNRVTITNRPSHESRINGAVIRIGNFLDIYNNPMWGFLLINVAADEQKPITRILAISTFKVKYCINDFFCMTIFYIPWRVSSPKDENYPIIYSPSSHPMCT